MVESLDHRLAPGRGSVPNGASDPRLNVLNFMSIEGIWRVPWLYMTEASSRTEVRVDQLSGDGGFLTPGQAARILGVSPKTVNRWANEGRLPCAVTLGGHRRFRPSVIAAAASSMGPQEPEHS